MAQQGRIVKVAGPLIVAENMADVRMYDVVRVSKNRLVGEVIELRGDKASIQVYEETSGLGPGEPVESTGAPLSVELGPGLIESIFDGIQRPLTVIAEKYGMHITRGVEVPSLNREKEWGFEALVKPGDKVTGGTIIGQVQESAVVEHRIMVPHGISGEIVKCESKVARLTDVVAVVRDEKGVEHELTMLQKWPVRRGRPYAEKLAPKAPMVTGQRVIDTFFPIASGGVAAVPGPFGSGKTVVQHQLAKWADADIIVYVGCGERGNEMTDVLREFPELTDPRTGQSLMKRTVLIANTSDMPVAAREASVYTGITIAEYFRDMGYDVAVIADSTSRWAEALREMSGRLEEMPGEEGYPAYLVSRLAQFYERAGVVRCMGSDERTGSVTAVGAVSPPGGDLSEPVAQGTMRIVKVFWSLDASLAYRRHFPAINWLNSYSLYLSSLRPWFDEHLGVEFMEHRDKAMHMLQQESDLQEIVQLVGKDALSPGDQLTLEVARMLREDFLQQNAFMDVDSYTSFDRQERMLSMILRYDELAREAIAQGAQIDAILELPVRTSIAQTKYEEPDAWQTAFDGIDRELAEQMRQLTEKAGEDE